MVAHAGGGYDDGYKNFRQREWTVANVPGIEGRPRVSRPLLLRMAPKGMPDTPLPPQDDEESVVLSETPGRPLVFRFTGAVGIGCRCVRPNQPLPRPSGRGGGALKRRFGSFSKSSSQRAVAYYEVTILNSLWSSERQTGIASTSAYGVVFSKLDGATGDDNRNKEEKENDKSDDSWRYGHSGRHAHAVAVGLATESFDGTNRMPGWKNPAGGKKAWSCGYHGDDGNVFAGRNEGHRYGRTFGEGDTVGCGIDYEARDVFFTLNGEFCGSIGDFLPKKGKCRAKMKRLLTPTKKLYPVVGVDTNAPIELNFGAKPFQFDLSTLAVHTMVGEKSLPHRLT